MEDEFVADFSPPQYDAFLPAGYPPQPLGAFKEFGDEAFDEEVHKETEGGVVSPPADGGTAASKKSVATNQFLTRLFALFQQQEEESDSNSTKIQSFFNQGKLSSGLLF